MKRIQRKDYFMKIAKVVAERSTCSRAKVGAVLVDEETNRIASVGYNGSIKGAPHCIDVGCLKIDNHCKRTIHAELNAVLQLERKYKSLILYCTHQPCAECTKALIMSNVTQIYYINEYKDKARDSILLESNLFQIFTRYYV